MDKNKVKRVDSRYKLLWLFSRTREVIMKVREKELREIGITRSEAAVLFIIDMLGGSATLEEISVWGFREGHSVSSQISRMEKEGLVKKVIESRGKNIKVEITEKGAQAHKLATEGDSIYGIFSSLSEEEQKNLFSQLVKLRKSAYQVLGIYRLPPWP